MKNGYLEIEKNQDYLLKTKNEIEVLIKGNDWVDLITTNALIEVLDSNHEKLMKEYSSIYDFYVKWWRSNRQQRWWRIGKSKGVFYSLSPDQEWSGAMLLINDQLLDCKQPSVVSLQPQRSDKVDLGLIMASSYKLPLLKLKEFEGELKNCLPFWSQFSEIDYGSSISRSDKFQHLIIATLPSLVARNVV